MIVDQFVQPTVCFRPVYKDSQRQRLPLGCSKAAGCCHHQKYCGHAFYIANRENQQSGFFHLLDIAPTHFLETEYYRLYFEEFVSVDEVQYNVKLDHERTLCISMGSKSRFTQEHIAIFDLIKPWVLALMKQRITSDTREERSSQPQQWQDKIIELAPQLTGREIEVLKLALSGFSNSEIAGKLSVSPETVKVHRRNFYSKLNIKSQSELFAYFFRAP
ncbi:helix-turn-helix domain-containing protein [Pseudomonas amygdali]|uniref:helix-turn-helix domain-containing protein n=1 Tax=Pseudomonas amygdali TaxID=47877 RepID=UPI00211DDBE3|nr:helix-turn-helix transcriptional regulator [Pseudomonas amygdali]